MVQPFYGARWHVLYNDLNRKGNIHFFSNPYSAFHGPK